MEKTNRKTTTPLVTRIKTQLSHRTHVGDQTISSLSSAKTNNIIENSGNTDSKTTTPIVTRIKRQPSHGAPVGDRTISSLSSAKTNNIIENSGNTDSKTTTPIVTRIKRQFSHGASVGDRIISSLSSAKTNNIIENSGNHTQSEYKAKFLPVKVSTIQQHDKTTNVTSVLDDISPTSDIELPGQRLKMCSRKPSGWNIYYGILIFINLLGQPIADEAKY
ncbi:unnamed protein product [Didymodactylos carnosus]|uniref:Uncharacterized protein n=1 Tax=Didymodactylos carnosus TaxID=1234261 RepID=A0A8S2DGX5_9BILA|nr:unnamed protein product [Didymodactylos carnosus]CAF3675482.1 unnamed protein product [Didymodactylos carnosus]